MSALWLLLIHRDKDIDSIKDNNNSANISYSSSLDEDTSIPWFVPVAVLLLLLFLVGGLMAATIS